MCVTAFGVGILTGAITIMVADYAWYLLNKYTNLLD